MRKGPTIIAAHIGMAISQHSALNPEDLGAQKGLPEELQKMLLGLQKYQKHPYKPERLPLDTVWKEGEVSLNIIPGYDYAPERPSMVLVPSLINKSYILDLVEGRSLMRWLAGQGINPYLLDWGKASADEGQRDLDALIEHRLVPALKVAAVRAGRPVHALGYCMGGTLLATAAAFAGDDLKSLIFLAAPWDFHAGSGTLLSRIQFWSPSAFPMIDEKGHLPVDWIQTLFASLDPSLGAKKFARFVDMDPASDETQLFIAVEDWLNDGIDLPGDLALQCLKGWFLTNDLVRGMCTINGHVVKALDIQKPALIVASSRDRLVEYDSAAALQQQIQGAQIIDVKSGHIGMIAGRRTMGDVWRPVAEWVHGRT